MNVAVIGGGAAGFFAAISVKENFPNATVSIFEKTQKVLAKVKVSGGGRCNVTNAETSIKLLSKAYPRGEKLLKKLLPTFSTNNTIEWFESRGVPLITQEDNCVFPVSQDSQSIIDCFLQECKRLKVHVFVGHGVESIKLEEAKWHLKIKKKASSSIFDKVIVATGGSPKLSGLEWLAELGHKIESPVPSLFTFNMPNESIKELMGIVVENAIVSIQGSKLKADGPLLITHWGMSGPAILKLSAFGARFLSECNYQFKVQVNWVNNINNALVRTDLENIVKSHPNKQLSNMRPYALPERLWLFLLDKCDLAQKKPWSELGKKGMNKLVTVLTNDVYHVEGKTTFKEEFVTCGGVSLDSINSKTMESEICPGLYFTGEVMDVDGITGGYNFQAAWTTAFVAACLG